MNPKLMGVRIPEGQRRGPVTDMAPGTVVQMDEMIVCSLGLVNEEGRVITTMAYKIGPEWWTDPNGEGWASNLLRANKDLTKRLDRAYIDAHERAKDKGPIKIESKVNVKAGTFEEPVSK